MKRIASVSDEITKSGFFDNVWKDKS
jgi:hypothetical protein